MTSKATTHVIRGKLHWAKLIGEPRMNTYTEEREWSVDVTPDSNGRAELKRIGVEDRLKTPKENDTRKESFVAFRQKEFRNDKSGGKVKNDPVRIVDAQGNLWPEGKLIGNETVADVKFRVPPKMPGKIRGVYIQAVRVLEHVPFEIEEFAPLSEDDKFFAGTSENAPKQDVDDLDDELDAPF